jgi:rhodanese-related sulfurtransferase
MSLRGGTMDPLISPAELNDSLAGQNQPAVIDVRSQEAYRAGHIPGARNIPSEEVEQSLGQIQKGRPVVTY